MMRFAIWLQSVPEKLIPPPIRLLQIGSAFWQSRVLHVAARLDVATVLGDRTMDVDELAAKVSADPTALYRALRMLAAMGLFEEVAPRRFANNRASCYLREDQPGCVRALVLMHNSDAMTRPWFEELEGSVRHGGVPFARTHGAELFDYLDDEPELDALFTRAMESAESLSGDSFARDFDWSRFERVIDLGGSKGGRSLAILKQHPRVRALVVDRPAVVRSAEQHWRQRETPELLARITFRAGDLTKEVPAAASASDVYFLSSVLHGLDDETSAGILRNLARSCAATGACIALMELVVPEHRANLASAALDMQMFMGTRGRERTLAEWSRLFEASGLRLEERVKLRSFPEILLLTPTGRGAG